MKTRSTKIVGLLVALVFLFAALPLRTQGVGDLSFDNLRFASEDGKWRLKWESGDLPDDVRVQYRSSGITDVWTSVDSRLNALSLSTWGDWTMAATFNPLINNPAGLTVDFRIQAALCNQFSDTVQCVWTSWANTSTTF